MISWVILRKYLLENVTIAINMIRGFDRKCSDYRNFSPIAE